MTEMTQRQRMIGFLKGEPIDQLPLCQYDNMNAPNQEIWDELGDNSLGVLKWYPGWTFELNRCRMEHEALTVDGYPGHRNTIITPSGSISEVRHELPFLTWDAVAAEYYIKEPRDYDILLEFLADLTILPNYEAVQGVADMLGEHGLPQVSMPRTPYQALWIEWTKMDLLAEHLADEPKLMDEVMQALGRHFVMSVEATAETARQGADFYHTTIGDNVHAPLIGPAMFEKWCVPYYNKATELLTPVGIKSFVHLDGDLKSIADQIDQCTFDGFDSFSPAPDNDTSVSEMVERWGDRFIWANFPSSIHLESSDVIYDTAVRMLADAHAGGAGKRFWIQLSENLPPEMWRKSIPAINRALAELGQPY